jgi:hypothetical protein
MVCEKNKLKLYYNYLKTKLKKFVSKRINNCNPHEVIILSCSKITSWSLVVFSPKQNFKNIHMNEPMEEEKMKPLKVASILVIISCTTSWIHCNQKERSKKKTSQLQIAHSRHSKSCATISTIYILQIWHYYNPFESPNDTYMLVSPRLL